MNLYLVTENENTDPEYDVTVAIIGCAKTKKEAEEILAPLVWQGAHPAYPPSIKFVGKAARGLKSGDVILKDFNNG